MPLTGHKYVTKVVLLALQFEEFEQMLCIKKKLKKAFMRQRQNVMFDTVMNFKFFFKRESACLAFSSFV